MCKALNKISGYNLVVEYDIANVDTGVRFSLAAQRQPFPIIGDNCG